MSFPNWPQEGMRGRSPRTRGHSGRGNRSRSSYQQHENETHPNTRGNQRGRPFYRGRGHAFGHRGSIVNRGRGWHHSRGNRWFDNAQATSVDVRSKSSYGCRGARGGKNESVMKPHHENEKFLDFPFLQQHDTVRLIPEFCIMFILRGVPGSGKSTVANAILLQYESQAVICSADYYRYNKDGEYVWHASTLEETHKKCQRRAEKFCCMKKPVVIIDNTNVTYVEMEPYIKFAKQYGYVVVLVEPRTPWKFQARELVKRSPHNVPFSTIRRKVEQFGDILPHYFGWFVSPRECVRLLTLAKDVLWKCLQITEFKKCITAFSGHSAPKFTVHNAMFYYAIKHSDSQNNLHVTACFSPRGKYLAGSLYQKSPAVEKAIGKISLVSIIGWVITNNSISARVILTKKQQELWMNDDACGYEQRKRGWTTHHHVEQMSSSFQQLQLEDHARVSEDIQVKPDCGTSSSTHITLGKRRDVSPVQAKHDIKTVLNHELSLHVFEGYTLHGDTGKVRKYSDNVWAVYLNEAHVIKVPAIFSGHYD